MGNGTSDQQKTLKVATINFNGVQYSPFEYYSEQHYFQEKQLNNIFQRNFSEHKKDLFTETIMKELKIYDKIIKQQRYSPLYNKLCGIRDGKFLNQQDFNNLWEETFKKTYAFLKIIKVINSDKKSVEEQIPQDLTQLKAKKQKQLKALRKFDYLVFISILQFIYQSKQINNIIGDRSCSKYVGFMNQFFSKTALNQNKKIIAAINFIENNQLDVFFMQEATTKFCDQFQRSNPDYRIIKSKDDPNQPGCCAVVFKESAFKKANIGRKGNLKLLQILNDTKLSEQQKINFLNWGRPAFISIDNFLLVSVKCKQFVLSDKDREKEKKKNQNTANKPVQDLKKRIFQDLALIRQKFPNKYLIVGGVMHSIEKLIELTNKQPLEDLKLKEQQQQKKFMNQQQKQDKYKLEKQSKIWEHFEVFPQGMITCHKKRTSIQFMGKKSNVDIREQNNFILYDKRLKLSKQIPDKDGLLLNIRSQKMMFPLESNKNKQIKKTKSLKIPSKKDKQSKQIGLLPSEIHPFDQFIVLKQLRIPLKKKKVFSEQQKQIDKKNKERLGFETSSSEEDQNQPNVFSGLTDLVANVVTDVATGAAGNNDS